MEHHPFKIVSEFTPQGDQPAAIEKFQRVLKKVNVTKRYSEQQVQVRPLR